MNALHTGQSNFPEKKNYSSHVNDVTGSSHKFVVFFFFFFFLPRSFLRPDYYQTPARSTVAVSLVIKYFCRLGTSCLPFDMLTCLRLSRFSPPHWKYSGIKCSKRCVTLSIIVKKLEKLF